jgi:hypothetical protein
MADDTPPQPSSGASTAGLRLLAEDADDLKIISAALQDAVAKVGDIRWEQRGRKLTIEFNRFRWEAGDGAPERVRAGLQLGGVLSVKARRVRRDVKAAVVELLALEFMPGEAPGGVVAFEFAGGGDLRVEVECVDAVLADLSRPWPARKQPSHDAGA